MAANPLEQFNIKPLIPFEIGGIDLAFTNSALFMVLTVLVASLLMLVPMYRASLIPHRRQNIPEMLYDIVHGIVYDVVGSEGAKYIPLVFTLFISVLLGNLIGLLPYAFTFTSHIIVTAAMGFLVISVVTIMGFVNHGWSFLSLFAPPGLPKPIYLVLIPLEVISFISRPITLAVRLCANMVAGHTVLKVIALFSVMMGGVLGILPALFNALIVALEVLVAMLQAYIFTILTCIYIKDAVEPHH
jgi:F-type H+-transporting ATPase subunit a